VRLRTKILLAFLAPMVLLAAVSTLRYQSLARVATYDRLTVHSQEVLADAEALVKAAVDAETGMRGFVITRKESFLQPYTAGLAAFDQTAARLQRLVSDNPAQLARVEQMITLHQRWVNEHARPVVAAARSGSPGRAVALVQTGRGKVLVDKLRAVSDDFLQAERDLLAQRTAVNNAALGRERFLAVATPLLIIVFTVAFALFLAGRIARAVGSVAAAAQAMAAGDLSQRAKAPSRDEVGVMAEAFNAMAERLQATAEAEREIKESLQQAVADYSAFAASVAEGNLTARVNANGSQDLQVLSEHLNAMVIGLSEVSGRVREGAQSIRAATGEILAAVSQHTASASEQSASISEATSTVTELRAAAEQTAQKAKEVADQAGTSVQVGVQGTENVRTIAGVMEEIRDRVEAIARDILALSEQSQQIGEITATVNDLADQSNILALNASIEAAKAGEHGKGFAVVATEVRNLAEQSKQATQQVRGILGDIQKATTAAVLATEQGTKVVEQGLTLTERASAGIDDLVKAIQEAAQAARVIAASAHQQSTGLDQISQAMKDVNEGTTQFVASAQQSQRAAEDLNELAGQLTSATDQYQVSAAP
jgi:methyl-accepting chemotaxis protein